MANTNLKINLLSMKKSLLLTAALVSGFALVAQTGKQIAPNRMLAQKVTGLNSFDAPLADQDAYPMGLTPRVGNPAHVMTGPPYPLIANTRNIVGTQTSELNTVSYNADLNAVVVITRFPTAAI